MNLFEMFEQPATFKDALSDFLPMCVGHLQLTQLPKIAFQKDIDATSFGTYDADTDTITLVLHNRQPVDILRTLAHELVHAQQRQGDKIKPGDGRTGSPIEDEANAEAGVIMRVFAQEYPKYLTLPAVTIPSQLEEKRKRKKKAKRSGSYYGYYWGGTNTSTENGSGDGGGGGESMNEGSSNDMSTKDMIAYISQHHNENLHPDFLNHVTSINNKFVLKNVPLSSIKTELSGLDREKVEQYKQMDFSKAPPIVIGSDGNIVDGYHRATVAKALGLSTIKAYVGVKNMQESLGRTALVGVLAAALSMVPAPAQAEPSDAAKALGIYRTINRYKDYNSAALEGEANQELMNILRSIQGHPNQSKLLPIIKKMITSDENGTAPTRDEDLPPMTLPGDTVQENFADGKKPGRKGLAKRSGVDCGQSVTALRKIAKNSSGERQRMSHWCANMKSGRNK